MSGPVASEHEKAFSRLRAISKARSDEVFRVADLIEQALYEAQSEETRDALVKLAHRVLKP